MKITFILPRADLSGGIKVVAIYADRLQKRGHDVTVFSLPVQPVNLKFKLKNLIRRGRWSREEKAQSHLDGLDIDHRVLEKYRPVTNDDVPDADVVIATWWETAEWVATLNSSKGKKVYFVQGHDIREGLPLDRVRATYRMPFFYIAVSKWLIDVLTNQYDTNCIQLVKNSVDSMFFDASKRIKMNVPSVGFVYSQVDIKGSDICIKALEMVQLKLPKIKILSFGSRQIAENLPIPETASFYYRPSQEKIREIYSSCDFWLFSSRAEGFGLPILEAMACRTPVIATRAGAAPELVGKGGGILLDDWGVEGMSEAIVKAVSMTPEDWQAMSCRAREIATEYSWDDATLLFEKALVSCVGNN